MKRVNSLMEAGTLREFIVMPSHAMIGAERFRATLYTDGYENEENLFDSIGSLPEVHGACRIVSARGGAYIVWGSYIGPIRLNEIGRYFRTLTSVEEIELHSVVANWSRFSNWGRGQKMELSRHHLLVLRSLRGNARIQVKELSVETGLSLRRVRRLLREIEESGAFYFVARTGPIVEGPAFVLKIRLAEDEMKPQQLHDWLQDTYPEHFFGLAFSVTEPVSFVQFGGCDVPQMIHIFRDIGRLPFVAKTTILMALSFAGFPHLMQLKLDEMLEGLDD
jgi:predicted transcriptional regulator